jgi:hypothetical protein
MALLRTPASYTNSVSHAHRLGQPTNDRTNSPAQFCIKGEFGLSTSKNLFSMVYLTSCSAVSSDHLPVLIDNACRSFFHHPPHHPDFRGTDWANFQAHLEDQILFDPELHNEMAIDTCVDNFSGAILKALAASTPKCRPHDDPRPTILASIQDEICLKKRLRRRW